MTDREAVEALRAIEKAEKAVDDLCQGRLRWEMRVPAEPDHDPDLIISEALRQSRAILARSTPDAAAGCEACTRGDRSAHAQHVPDAAAETPVARLDVEKLSDAGSRTYRGPHKLIGNGLCEHRWRNRTNATVHCGRAEGYAAGRAATPSPDGLEALRAALSDVSKAYAQHRQGKLGPTGVSYALHVAEAALRTALDEAAKMYAHDFGVIPSDAIAAKYGPAK